MDIFILKSIFLVYFLVFYCKVMLGYVMTIVLSLL